ncbi:ABC transporter substrate-binding protein [Streptomyces sp. NPDC006879]|uniref:ABC transporter substrate-binding protein n=1 Tax=Streptomyces sp. NPDC006879 TaxID=3364767 RepID=UPI0036CEEAB0
MNRKILVLATAGLLTPVLAGCGTATGGASSDGAIVVGTTDRFQTADDAPAPFDPAHAYDAGAWNVLRQTVQTLMHIPRGGGEPVPEAASQCRFTDRTNESYRCTLRKGLEFANGDPITVQDVKFSIERVLAIKDENGPATLLSTLDAIEIKGGDEVVFHLKSPDATFPYKLSTPAAGIVNSKTYEATRLRAGFEVDGSGPYTMKAEVDGDEMVRAVFTKNPKYRGDLKVKNDKVVLRSFADSEAMNEAVSSGAVHVAARSLSPEQIKQQQQTPAQGVKLVEQHGLEIRYLGFDTEDEAVGEKAVRQAIAAVVNRRELTEDVYGKTAEPLYSLIPSSVSGHVNSFFNQYGEGGDQQKAAALLREAKVKTPVKLTLHYTTDHYGDGTAAEFELLKKQLSATKLFDVDVQGTAWAQFRPAQKEGEFAVYGLGWFPDFPDPDNFVAPFLDTDNFLGTPYVNNTIRGKLIPDSRRAVDRNAAAGAFNKIQDLVAEDVPVLPLWQGKQYVAAWEGITGVEWSLNTISELQLWELGRGTS